MDKLLEIFFQSNEFWKKFSIEYMSNKDKCFHINYRYDIILLRFFEIDNVKSIHITVDDEVVVNYMFWLNVDELALILNRVAQIRAANPLCSGSESIRALSCES